jgi:hypothetical protein
VNGIKRRWLTATAVAVMVVLPTLAFFLAPSARADDSPGANLAGINVSSVAQAALFEPLLPGLVGAGDVSQGNLFEVAMPYASAASSTGPSGSGVATPVYPGSTASQLGTVLSTFQPIPAPLENALNDPVLAQSDYPPQVNVGSSSSYSPPGGSATGVGTASSNASAGGVTSSAATSDTVLPAQLLEISSSTATASTQVQASSVQATAHTDIGTIKLLGGVVTISGLGSDASAYSDGNNGQPSSDLKIGSVTVAGQSAYIGADGIHLSGNSQFGVLVPILNQALAALAQAGLSVRTIAPTQTTDGTSAEVTSGALQISFVDSHIPNPNGQVPISSIGFNIDLGMSQAEADATALPPFTPIGSGSTDSGTQAPAASTPVSAGQIPALSTSGSPPVGGGSAVQAASPGSASTGSSSPSTALGAPATTPGTSRVPAFSPKPAAYFGLPVKAAWVLIAGLLSLVAAGPLLGYANWQLLRGRKT